MLPVAIFGFLQIQDDEYRQEINQYNIERRIMRSESDPFTLRDNQFIDLFRLTKDMVNYLFERIIPHMTYSAHPSGIDPPLRVFATLYFYATGSYQRTVGQSYQISMAQNTVSICLTEVTNLICDHLSAEWIVFPTTFNEKLRIKRKFMDRFHFPGCIGAIDCTHVAIIAPHEEEHNYFNRKGYHSINVQIVCDPDLRILNINARWGGATHDAFIWRNSNIKTYMQQNFANGDRSWLIGDSGYPQEPFLMTPILNPVQGSPQDRYTTAHIAARNCIERCNGVLKGRFRCILGERMLRYSPPKCGNITTACAVLHNICLDGRLQFEDPVDHNNEIAAGAIIAIPENPMGQNVRNNLIQQYFN